MKVLITGGLGFVGMRLAGRLLGNGHEVTLVDHAPAPKPDAPRDARYVSADTSAPGPWQAEVSGHDLLINLAGASIFRRWSRDSKKLMRDSRIFTTRNLVDAIEAGCVTTLISASAVGYYGFRGDETLSETDGPGSDFLANLAREWEAEARKAESKGARVVLTRFGIVLGRGGGALHQMKDAFEKFVGGTLGSGRQWFSWIHIDDLLKAIQFIIDNPGIAGPVNCCSLNPVRNHDLAKELGKAMHRPSFVSMPAFMLRLTLGEFASVLLEGQRVVPTVLQGNNFQFEHPHLPEVLASILDH